MVTSSFFLFAKPSTSLCILTTKEFINHAYRKDTDLQAVVNKKPFLVILADKFIQDETYGVIWLADFFESHKIHFTGSRKSAIKFDIDKLLAKKQIHGAGILTPRFFTAIPGQHVQGIKLPLDYPLFIKPTQSTNSEGIDKHSIVKTEQQFSKQVSMIFSVYNKTALAESYLPGREFTVAIIQTVERIYVAPLELTVPINIDSGILSHFTKQRNVEQVKTILEPELHKKVTDFAIQCFCALGAQGFGRVDIKMDANQNCSFMEINLTPGLNQDSAYFPKAFRLNNMLNYPEMILLMMGFDLC